MMESSLPLASLPLASLPLASLPLASLLLASLPITFRVLLECQVLSERLYWNEGSFHLNVSAEISRSMRTMWNGGSFHFFSEAHSIFTFWSESYEIWTADSGCAVRGSYPNSQAESYGERSCKFDRVDLCMV
jgi:hypothetical protein